MVQNIQTTNKIDLLMCLYMKSIVFCMSANQWNANSCKKSSRSRTAFNSKLFLIIAVALQRSVELFHLVSLLLLVVVNFLPDFCNQVIVSVFFRTKLLTQKSHDSSIPMTPKSRACTHTQKEDQQYQNKIAKKKKTLLQNEFFLFQKRRDLPLFPDVVQISLGFHRT